MSKVKLMVIPDFNVILIRPKGRNQGDGGPLHAPEYFRSLRKLLTLPQATTLDFNEGMFFRIRFGIPTSPLTPSTFKRGSSHEETHLGTQLWFHFYIQTPFQGIFWLLSCDIDDIGDYSAMSGQLRKICKKYLTEKAITHMIGSH